jgi:hypothetical protein
MRPREVYVTVDQRLPTRVIRATLDALSRFGGASNSRLSDTSETGVPGSGLD